jgi:hypothetical protein
VDSSLPVLQQFQVVVLTLWVYIHHLEGSKLQIMLSYVVVGFFLLLASAPFPCASRLIVQLMQFSVAYLSFPIFILIIFYSSLKIGGYQMKVPILCC